MLTLILAAHLGLCNVNALDATVAYTTLDDAATAALKRAFSVSNNQHEVGGVG
jgi:hypothetical protein